MIGPINIYTAGPIDLGNDTKDWRLDLETELSAAGCIATIFNPQLAYSQSLWGKFESDVHNLNRAKYIYGVNSCALQLADIAVFSVPSNVQTIGTIVELQMCHKRGIPVYLLTDIPVGKSVYLDVMTDSLRRFPTLDLLVDKILLEAKNIVVESSDMRNSLFDILDNGAK